jgi:hypothetical protein
MFIEIEFLNSNILQEITVIEILHRHNAVRNVIPIKLDRQDGVKSITIHPTIGCKQSILDGITIL